MRLTAEALEEYRLLPLTIRARVAVVLERLALWPDVSGTKPLRKSLKGLFRIRTGDWRIVIKPVGHVVWVVRIDNRRDVYEE